MDRAERTFRHDQGSLGDPLLHTLNLELSKGRAMIPDNETLRMMRELREKMPDSATQRMIQQALQVARDPVREAMIRQHLEFRNQYGDQIKAIAQTIAQNESLKLAVAAVPAIMASQQANRELHLAVIKAVQSISQAIPRETLNSVAQVMLQFRTGPTFAALQTIREMGFGGLSDEFPDFEATIIKEAPTAEPKEVKRAVKKYVEKKKKRGLTLKQWNALMRYIAIFSLLVSIYGVLPKQNANNTNINLSNTFIVHPIYSQASRTQSYWTERECELKARANFKSATIAVIRKRR